MMVLDWANPKALLVLPIWLLVIVAVAWGMKRKRRRLTFWLSSDSLQGWWRRACWQVILLSAATLFMAVALARPRWFAGKVTVPAIGADIVICVDVSHSMLCEDLKPSRLEFAQTIISNLLDRLSPDDRIALVVFGGRGFLLCPLTDDREIVRAYLSALGPKEIRYNPTTYIAEGLTTSLKLLKRKQQKERRGSVIILLSDGEDHRGDWGISASACRRAGVPVFAFAMGTEKGALVPDLTEEGTVQGYKRDADGNLVISRLHLDVLKSIAKKTRGKVYLPADGTREVTAFLNSLAAYRQRVLTKEVALWWELFPLLLVLSVMLLITESWLIRPLR